MAESKTTQQQGGGGASTGSSKTEFPCPDCGEMVREGLVRCWNCGGFLSPELEQQFQEIQSRPQQVIYSPPVGDEGTPDLDAMLAGPSSAGTGGEEGDFELSGGGMVAPAAPSGETPVAGAPSGATSAGDADLSAEETTLATEGESESKSETEAGGSDAPQSTVTGGDDLMQLAAQEEMESLKRKMGGGTSLEGVKQIRDGFLIDAPKGCRIQIRDERTGEMRRLTFGASSRVRISLLDKLEAIQKAEAEKQAKKPAGPQHLCAGVYKRWMSDCRLHTLNPEKLKLKADSMAKEFVPVEVGFAADSMLVASLAAPKGKKGGLFSKGDKSEKPAADPRSALLGHFRAGKSVADAPVGENKSVTADQVAQLRIVQPAPSLTESLFAGIPVFGTGRIAVQLPLLEAGEQPQYLSFALTEFRKFAEIIGSLYSMAEFGHNAGIPLADSFTEHKCHYSSAKVRALEYLGFYEADPEIELTLSGWLCSACGLVVSEDARQEEKLGGKAGKGLAKAKCPKCEQKFGSNPLYTLASTDSSASPSGDEAAAADDADSPAS